MKRVLLSTFWSLAAMVPAALAQAPQAEPTSPPARHVHDTRDRLRFDVPAGWNFSRRDGELSTFALDARSALERTRMHAVANLDFNPFPLSTFSGSLFYVSATASSTDAACANQAAAPASHPVTMPVLDGVTFKHGYNEHGSSCIESRDEIYTAMRGGSCLRFDLVINSFCGAGSGARDMTAVELGAVRARLEGVLQSVRFDAPSSEAPAVSGRKPGSRARTP